MNTYRPFDIIDSFLVHVYISGRAQMNNHMYIRFVFVLVFVCFFSVMPDGEIRSGEVHYSILRRIMKGDKATDLREGYSFLIWSRKYYIGTAGNHINMN